MDNYKDDKRNDENFINTDADINIVSDQIQFSNYSNNEIIKDITDAVSFGGEISNSIIKTNVNSNEEKSKANGDFANFAQLLDKQSVLATETLAFNNMNNLEINENVKDNPQVNETMLNNGENNENTDNEVSQLSDLTSNIPESDKNDDNLDNSFDYSSDSDFSDISGLSDISGKEWKPTSQKPFHWVQKQFNLGANPRELLYKFLPYSAQRISPELTEMTLWKLLANMLSEPPRRQKLSYINTFDDVIYLLEKCNNIIVLTGAGVSVSCGIPDFRSSDGIYSRLAKDFPDMPDPQAMFDINYFSRDPRPFYKFAREIYPGQFRPSPCHRFIKMLEKKQKLLRNYTQNIDTLEQVAGIKNVIECHGSFSTASCTKCKYKCDADTIRNDIYNQHIPVCPRCQPNVKQSVDTSQPVTEMELQQLVENGIMKPDIVFFGEDLPNEFHSVMANDKDKCDLLIVIGSSLKVRPVALIPSSIPAHIPQILINREQLPHLEFDVELLGDGDVIINQICHRLGDDWKEICFSDEILIESKELNSLINREDNTTECESDEKTTISSIDLQLRSCREYLDSGFESSTSLCGLSTNTISTKTKEKMTFLSPEHGENVVESTSKRRRLLGHRHISVDSSKDSGIQLDTNVSETNISFNTNEDIETANKCCEASSVESVAPESPSKSPTNSKQQENLSNNECMHESITNSCADQRPLTAGERLQKGTYFCHKNSNAFVFPGAQVSWCCNPEEDENVFEDNINQCSNKDYQDCENLDTILEPLSPLMTPSTEAEMVTAISTANTTSTSTTSSILNATALSNTGTSLTVQMKKRRSSETEPQQTIQSDRLNLDADDSPSASIHVMDPCTKNSFPPLKRPCSTINQITASSSQPKSNNDDFNFIV